VLATGFEGNSVQFGLWKPALFARKLISPVFTVLRHPSSEYPPSPDTVPPSPRDSVCCDPLLRRLLAWWRWCIGRSTGESSVVGSMALHSVRSRDEPCGRPGSRSIRDHCFVWDSNPTKNLLYGALRWWRSKPTNMPAPGRWWVGAFIGPSEPVLGRALDFWINKRALPDVRPRGVLSYPLVLLGNWSDNPFARPRAGRGKHHAIAVM